MTVVVLAGIVLSSLATAAVAQQANPGFDPRQTERRLDELQSGDTRGNAQLQIAAPRRSQTAADDRQTFLLRGVDLGGASSLSGDRLAEAYLAHVGKKVSQADLAAIAQSMSDIYRASGFHLSRAVVPPQDIENGRVRIRVIEGAITEVALKGDGAEQFGVRHMLDPVLAERPSRLPTLERQLLLVNGLPGVRIVDTALEEIGGATGSFRLVVTLKTWHVYASLGMDNLGAAAVGPWQTYAVSAFNSYLRTGDTLAVNLSTVANDPRQLGFGRLSYDTPVGVDGVRLGASALYSEVRPGDDRRLYNDDTRTESFELRGSIVPIQSQRSTLTLTLASGFGDVRETAAGGTIYDDRIRTISFSSDYRLKDGFGGTNYATAIVRQGLDVFGASPSNDLVSRAGAAPTFSVLNLYYTRYQTLNDAWSAKIAVASQTASGPLYTSQQFYLGGASFGRGYAAAEISGDNGIGGSIELRFDQSPGFRYLSGYQIYAFADAGAVWNYGYRLDDGLALTSVGAGVRFFLWDDFKADIGVAVPLSYRAPTNETRSARLLFSISNALTLCPDRGTSHCP